MKHLAGQNRKKIVLLTVASLLIIIYKTSSGSYKQIDAGENYFLTIVTPTIQTIARIDNQLYGQKIKGKHSLIRGKIEFISFSEWFIAGYLSVRFFKEDELIGLEGKNDKEGFFIIDKKSGNVESGLTGVEFFYQMEHNYNKKELNFSKPSESY